MQVCPLLGETSSLVFEEPMKRENIKLVNKKFVPHKDTAGSFKLDI